MEFSGSIVMTLVFVSLLFAVSSGILASKKNRNYIGWFFTGLLFGPFALFVVLLPLLTEKTKDNTNLWTSWKFWTVWVSLFGLIALLAFGFTTDPKIVPSPLVGRPAPDFELTALKGEETIHLSELRGTPVLLNFWASWCQECKVEVHILEEFHKKYGSGTKQIRVIGIAIQDTLQNAQAFARRFGKVVEQKLTQPGKSVKFQLAVLNGLSLARFGDLPKSLHTEAPYSVRLRVIP